MFVRNRSLLRKYRLTDNDTFYGVLDQLGKIGTSNRTPPLESGPNLEEEFSQSGKTELGERPFVPEIVQQSLLRTSQPTIERSDRDERPDEDTIARDVRNSLLAMLEKQNIWRGVGPELAKASSDQRLTPAQRFYVENKDLLLHRAVAYSIDQSVSEFEKATQDIEDDWRFYRDPVVRPQRGHLWSTADDAQQSDRADEIPFHPGSFPTVEELVNYLRIEQISDIITIDLEVCGRRDIGEWAIIGTAQSSAHARRVGNRARRKINELDLEHVKCFLNSGIPGQEWVVTRLGPVILHLMTQSDRVKYKLEEIFTVPLPSSEDIVSKESLEASEDANCLGIHG
jgi:ribosomal silencing factor RsfS